MPFSMSVCPFCPYITYFSPALTPRELKFWANPIRSPLGRPCRLCGRSSGLRVSWSCVQRSVIYSSSQCWWHTSYQNPARVRNCNFSCTHRFLVLGHISLGAPSSHSRLQLFAQSEESSSWILLCISRLTSLFGVTRDPKYTNSLTNSKVLYFRM
jgi:hypothetical protein